MYTFGFLTPETGVIVLVIALIIFGPGKLPDLGRSLGQGIKEFKSATNGEVSNTNKNNNNAPDTDKNNVSIQKEDNLK